MQASIVYNNNTLVIVIFLFYLESTPNVLLNVVKITSSVFSEYIYDTRTNMTFFVVWV